MCCWWTLLVHKKWNNGGQWYKSSVESTAMQAARLYLGTAELWAQMQMSDNTTMMAADHLRYYD